MAGQWVGLPFYDRVGGYWLREDKFKEDGFDVDRQFDRWTGVLEAARRVSNPEQNFYGWGMTVNRSGDGESLVWAIIHHWGGALADRTGEIVTLNSPDEARVLQRRLPASRYRFVELVEPGRADWLRAACASGVRCDVLVVSGHFNAGEAFYNESILRSMSNGVLTLDAANTISKVNPSALRILQRAEQDTVSRKVGEVFDGPNSWVTHSLEKVLRTGRIDSSTDVPLRRITYGKVWPAFANDTAPLGEMISAKDVISRRRPPTSRIARSIAWSTSFGDSVW